LATRLGHSGMITACRVRKAESEMLKCDGNMTIIRGGNNNMKESEARKKTTKKIKRMQASCMHTTDNERRKLRKDDSGRACLKILISGNDAYWLFASSTTQDTCQILCNTERNSYSPADASKSGRGETCHCGPYVCEADSLPNRLLSEIPRQPVTRKQRCCKAYSLRP
jgi:hypothetical protein